MNQCIVDFLSGQEKFSHFSLGLPGAFEIIKNQLPGNSAQGLLREQAIIGYFRFAFGDNKVKLPSNKNEKDFNVILCGKGLAISTAQGRSPDAIKIHWTSDNQRVEEEVATYYPTSDFLWITIHWGKTADSIFYVPLSAQSEIHSQLGKSGYLKTSPGTNNRGIPLSKEAFKMLKSHPKTLCRQVTWRREGIAPDPYKQWETYWANRHKAQI